MPSNKSLRGKLAFMPEIENWQICGIDLELALQIFNLQLTSCLIYTLAQCLSALPPPRVGNIIPIIRNGKKKKNILTLAD